MSGTNHQAPGCPLVGRSPEDILFYLSPFIESHLQSRHLSKKEIEVLSELFEDIAHSAILLHGYECPLREAVSTITAGLEKARAREAGKKELKEYVLYVAKISAQIIVGLVALAGFIKAFTLGSAPQAPPDPPAIEIPGE